MLTIHINKNATGLVNYYSKSLSKDDYFFSNKSIPGRWHGRLAKELGLPEKVSQKDFSALAHNKHPKTGKQLTVRDAGKNRRTSIEYTFSCPKSVSIVMSISEKEQGRAILNAHRLAVKKAMKEIEHDMQTQTRIEGRKTYATTGNMVYARFDHFTARPTKIKDDKFGKYASDPHLHSHAVVFNCTKYKDRLQAVEGSTVHKCAQYYEAVYHAHLSKSLENLGYRIERNKHRYEIKGITREVVERFSNRTLDIQEFARKHKITDAKALGQIGAKIRVNKSAVKEDVDLKKIWNARLSVKEKNTIKNVKTDNQKPARSITPERAIDLAIEHHLERNSTVATKKLLATAMANGYGDLKPEQVKKALAAKEDVLYAQRGYLE